MSGRPARRSGSLRTGMTVTVTTLLLAFGVTLVGAVYLVVDRSLSLSSAVVSVSSDFNADDPVGTFTPFRCAEDENVTTCASPDGHVVFEQHEPSTAMTEMILNSQDRMAASTIRSIALWSGGIAVVFGVAAVLTTRWVMRRSLRRLEEATEAARRIGADRLDSRLAIDGPADEVKELGDTIDAMLDRLSAAMDAQNRFVANASHELRTPLATARAALDVPLAQGRVPADLQPAVRRALAANERSTRLLDALLTLARTEGDTHPALEEDRTDHVDLAAVVRAALADHRPSAEARDLTIDADFEPAVLLGDEAMLLLLSDNLVGNAVRHNRHGGTAHIRVTVEGSGDTERAVLEIENDGAPLDPDGIDALREPFNRGEDSRLARTPAAGAPSEPVGTGTGLGLGLAIVDQVVARHRGTLTLSARPGGGLVVAVRLPARSMERAAAGASTHEPRVTRAL